MLPEAAAEGIVSMALLRQARRFLDLIWFDHHTGQDYDDEAALDRLKKMIDAHIDGREVG